MIVVDFLVCGSRRFKGWGSGWKLIKVFFLRFLPWRNLADDWRFFRRDSASQREPRVNWGRFSRAPNWGSKHLRAQTVWPENLIVDYHLPGNTLELRCVRRFRRLMAPSLKRFLLGRGPPHSLSLVLENVLQHWLSSERGCTELVSEINNRAGQVPHVWIARPRLLSLSSRPRSHSNFFVVERRLLLRSRGHLAREHYCTMELLLMFSSKEKPF